MSNICALDEIQFLNFANISMGFIHPTLLDVGTNHGDFTDEFLQKFPTAKCYGFEPIPEIFNQVQERFKSDNRVKLYNFGLYNETIKGKEFYYIKDSAQDQRLSGMSSIHNRPVYFPRFEKELIKVDLFKLDDVVSLLNPVDYLKIDTEGSELMVLQGGTEFLKNTPPYLIQWEYGGCYTDSQTTGREVIKLLNDTGYKVVDGFLKETTLENFVEDYVLRNYLAIKLPLTK